VARRWFQSWIPINHRRRPGPVIRMVLFLVLTSVLLMLIIFRRAYLVMLVMGAIMIVCLVSRWVMVGLLSRRGRGTVQVGRKSFTSWRSILAVHMAMGGVRLRIVWPTQAVICTLILVDNSLRSHQIHPSFQRHVPVLSLSNGNRGADRGAFNR
jgi:hypothetical protein